MDLPAGPPATAEAMADDLALLEALVAHAPLGLGFWDTDLRYRRVNDALAAFNGLRPVEHLGRTPGELLGPLGEEAERMLRAVLRSGEPILAAEVTGETPAAPGQPRHWHVSFYPVEDASGARRGVAAVVEDVTEQREAEQERTRLLQEALVARERAERASRDAQEARRRSEFLAAAGARLAAMRDFEATVQETAAVGVPALADWSALTLVEPGGRLRTAAVADADVRRAAAMRTLAETHPLRIEGTSMTARAMRTGELELVRELSDAHLAAVSRDREHLAALQALGLRSVVVAPLRAASRIVGALALGRGPARPAFSDDEVALVRGLAASAALHVDNARLATERAHVARTLQSSLLPRSLPGVPGLELAARYLAAGDANDVGGDFYDVFANGDGTWTAVIGDVSGKGAEAAALTSLMRHTLRAAALREASPAASLALLNEVLVADGDTARFCTALALRIRPAADGPVRLTVATGGHLPPVHVHADGRLERLPVRGTLLGALAEPAFLEVEATLAAGDLLVLHTDGVTELRGQEPEEGERRLLRVLGRHAGDSAEAVVDAVQRSAVGAQNGVPRDDIAVLALRAT